MEAIFVLFGFAFGFGLFGAWLNGQKGKSGLAGFVVAFMFGPLGILVLLFLPSAVVAVPPPARRIVERYPVKSEVWMEMGDEFPVLDPLPPSKPKKFDPVEEQASSWLRSMN